MIKAIFFDVANTLLFKPDLIPNIQSVLSESGYSMKIDEIQLAHQKLTEEVVFPDTTDKSFYQEFNALLCEALNIEPSQAIVDAIYIRSKGLKWKPFDDAAILTELDIPTGIGSNWDSSLREKLTNFFIVDFKWVLVSEEMGIKKPDPAFFLKMIEISGYEPNEIMFVGDSMRLDIAPSIELGIESVLVDRTDFYTSYEGKKVNKLSELPKWL